MISNFLNLPAEIQSHLKSLVTSVELPQNEESLEILAQNWLAKLNLFDSLTKNLALQQVDSLALTSKQAFLVITYSGSLLGLGPELENGRTLEYASIKLRSDIPSVVNAGEVRLIDEIKIGQTCKFENSPLKATSAIFKIAVCSANLEIAEQQKRINEAMMFLTNAFVKVNRQSFIKENDIPELFTLHSLVKYLASKNKISQKQIKQILSDFFSLIEIGILLGEKAPLGKLGKAYLIRKPPRKPRVLKNRFTGKEITIPALPERCSPKFKFSKSLKLKVQKIPADTIAKVSQEN